MTQAINLANFSNGVDSAGQIAPTALNAPVPVSKGGTGSSTTAGAATALAAAFGNLLFPIGSIYTNTSNGTNPATLLGFGTWSLFSQGRVLVGHDGGVFPAGSTGGTYTAALPSHTHSFSGTTGGQSADHSHVYQYGGNAWNQGPYGSASHNGTTSTSGTSNDHNHNFSGTTNAQGVDPTYQNLQPYIVVYMWQRTA